MLEAATGSSGSEAGGSLRGDESGGGIPRRINPSSNVSVAAALTSACSGTRDPAAAQV